MKKLLPLLLLVSACPTAENPPQLWIALDGVGLKLVDEEPDPF